MKLLGVIPTPAVAYLTKKLNADASVVISASHNTFEFNGIKFFSNKGMKIPDEIEEEIEEIMESGKLEELTAKNEKIGVSEIDTDLINEYRNFIINNFKDDIDKNLKSNFVVGIDTANGATYKVAEDIFKNIGINYKIISNNPNGININDNCGSTHLEQITKYVKENNLSLGIAYDGDGDRCLAVDEKGNVIDGDIILAAISNYMNEKEKLKDKTLVATIMSNIGLKKYADDNGLVLKQTKVGDRYVLEEMLKNNYNLGGEQSGHIIMLDYNPTGDGILTSLMLIKILLEKNIKASELFNLISIYPQVLVNAKVDDAKKYDYSEDKEVQEKIKKLEEEFLGEGRVLIRTSGTEPLVRVMIEGKDKEKIQTSAKELADLIEKKFK